MAQNLIIAGASYSDVPAIDVTKSGGGLARFMDTSNANALSADILLGKTAYVNGVLLTGTYVPTNPFALILVTYPIDSDVACTNSSGFKDMSPTQRLFYISENTVPFNCEISCTDGIYTDSKTVTITYEGQCESIFLRYGILYENGNQCIPDTGGWGEMHNSGSTVTFNETNIAIASPGTQAREATVFTVNPVNSRTYTTLKCNYSCTSRNLLYLGFLQTKQASSSSAFSSYVALPTGINLTGELTISSPINDCYIGIYASVGKGIYITKVWLE